jgi:hypothetical protein
MREVIIFEEVKNNASVSLSFKKDETLPQNLKDVLFVLNKLGYEITQYIEEQKEK